MDAGNACTVEACSRFERRSAREWSHPETARFQDGEVACPVIALFESANDGRRGGIRRRRSNAQEEDTAPCRQRRGRRQLAEVLIEGQADAPLAGRPSQHIGVGDTGGDFPDPGDLMAAPAKRLDKDPGNVLVAQPAHRHAALG